MLWFFLTPILLFLAWYYLVKPYNYWKDRGVSQGKPWWILGEMWPQVFKTMAQNDWIEWMYYFHPDKRYTGVYCFLQPVLTIRDPELIKQLAVRDFDHFTDHRNFSDDGCEPMFSRNLFSLKGQHWRDMRSTLSGSFTSSKMKYIFHTIEEAAKNFAKYFEDQDQEIVELEMKDTYRKIANDVIASAAFGIQVDSLKNPKNDFYLMGKELFNLTGMRKLKFFIRFLAPPLFRILKLTIFPKNVSDYFQEIINETIEVREKNKIVRPDMINLLLEIKHGVKQTEEKVDIDSSYATVEELDTVKTNKKQTLAAIDNEYIASQALVFFLAGFDSVSTGMSFTTYELACNPDVQQKLRKEIKKTFNECNGKVTHNALLKMKYMDMVVSEALRLWHPAGTMDRVCTKPLVIEPTQPGEKAVKLNKDDVILFPYCAIQKDPKYWPNPKKFDPERFSDENKDKIVPYTYLPFGVGPRNCIGSRFALLEIKCMLFHILQKHEFVPTRRTQIPLVLAKDSLTTTAQGGFWLGIKKVES